MGWRKEGRGKRGQGRRYTCRKIKKEEKRAQEEIGCIKQLTFYESV